MSNNSEQSDNLNQKPSDTSQQPEQPNQIHHPEKLEPIKFQNTLDLRFNLQSLHQLEEPIKFQNTRELRFDSDDQVRANSEDDSNIVEDKEDISKD